MSMSVHVASSPVVYKMPKYIDFLYSFFRAPVIVGNPISNQIEEVQATFRLISIKG